MFLLSEFDDLGHTSTYKAKDNDCGSKVNTSIPCLYKIEGEPMNNNFFAINYICSEACYITNKDRVVAKIMENHGWTSI